MAIVYEQLDDRRLGHLLRRRSTRLEKVMEVYRVPEDVTETLADGRTIQVAAKGTEIPVAEARRLGLVKDAQEARPSETKTPKNKK